MNTFTDAVAVVLQHEGGFTDDPGDYGNWTGGRPGVGELKGTNFGISAKSYPHLNIKALTRDDAIAIYRRDYWDALKADLLPYPIALVCFDNAVNCGVGKAKEWLQESLSVTVDGKIGPQTIGAAQRAPDPLRIVTGICRRRVLYYAELANFPSYGRTWVQRTFETFRACLEAA